MADRKRNVSRIGIALAAIAVVGAVLALGGLLYARSLLSPGSLTDLLNNAVGPATDGLYRVEIGESSFSLLGGDLRLGGVRLLTDAAGLGESGIDLPHPAIRFGVGIDSLRIEGLSLIRLAIGRDFVAREVVVENADVVAIFHPVATGDREQISSGETETAPAAAPLPVDRIRAALVGAPTIAVDRVALIGGALRIETLEHDPGVAVTSERVASSDVVGAIDIELNRIHIDEDADLAEIMSLYTDDIRIRVSDVVTPRLGGGILHVGELTASSKEERVAFSGLRLEPETTIAEYLARPGVKEGDRVSVIVNALAIDGLGFSRYLTTREIFVRGIEVDGFRVDVLSDKRKPHTPSTRPAPMPHDFFQALEVPFTLEQLQLRNGQVTYSELAPDGNAPGTLTFGQIEGQARNVSNEPARMSPETPLVFEATTRVNDAADATVQWRIPLLSRRPTMTTTARISAFDPALLNPTLEPLLGARVKSGFIQSIAYELHYGPDGIRGEVDAYYRDLAVQLLDKKTRRRSLGNKLMGFIANTVAIRDSNPGRPGEAPHRGIVAQPIDPTDPFFKLIWIGLRDGMAEVVARIR